MRVLFLSAANSIHTVKWVNALAERGHEIHLVYNSGHKPADDKIDNRIHLHQMKHGGMKGYYLNAPELHGIVKRVKPDVINVHYASGYGTLARWSRIAPYLLSVWGSDVYEFPYRGKINKYILKKNVENARMLASTSECMAQQLRRVLEKPDLDVKITPFGVNLELFSEKTSIEMSADEIVIGNIKTLKQVYRIEDLVKAIDLLLQKLREEGKKDVADKIRVHIYGDGDLREEIKKLIVSLSLEQVIFLKGRIPNTAVPETLQQFDIFCATSEKESFGVAVVEAMAMARPVVVTDAEGFREVAEDGVTGFVVQKRNVEAIAEGLKQLILDEDMRKRFGQAGRQRVETLYDWEKNVSTMEILYEQLKGL